MILKENIVYFEDADSYKEVHDYFSKLFQAQSEVENGFDEIVKKIKRHFISNMDKNEYSAMLRKYKKFVEKLKKI